MKIDKPKEWWLKKADLEGDCPIGAGALDHASMQAEITRLRAREVALLNELNGKDEDFVKGYDQAVEEIVAYLAQHNDAWAKQIRDIWMEGRAR